MSYIYDLVDTWNAGGTTFTAIKMNVTDSASSANSLLMDLQVGGTSRFSIAKDGATQWRVSGAIEVVARARAGSAYTLYNVSNLGFFDAQLPGVTIRSTASFSFGSGNDASAGSDLSIFRDAADILAQRRGVNAQTLRVYNTFTDASNYERGFIQYASNVLRIGHEGAGTGNNSRAIELRTNGFSALSLDTNAATFGVNLILGTASINTMQNIANQNGYTQMQEMTAPAAPATDRVRIYAEDNGSGKTRLMARFATGAAVQIAIEP